MIKRTARCLLIILALIGFFWVFPQSTLAITCETKTYSGTCKRYECQWISYPGGYYCSDTHDDGTWSGDCYASGPSCVYTAATSSCIAYSWGCTIENCKSIYETCNEVPGGGPTPTPTPTSTSTPEPTPTPTATPTPTPTKTPTPTPTKTPTPTPTKTPTPTPTKTPTPPPKPTKTPTPKPTKTPTPTPTSRPTSTPVPTSTPTPTSAPTPTPECRGSADCLRYGCEGDTYCVYYYWCRNGQCVYNTKNCWNICGYCGYWGPECEVTITPPPTPTSPLTPTPTSRPTPTPWPTPTPPGPATATIEGQVFVDNDKDGVIDPGERCYSGNYTIKLDGVPYGGFCAYSISNVTTGWHWVELNPIPGYRVTGWNQGGGKMGDGGRAYIKCGSPDILNFGIEPIPTSTPTPTPSIIGHPYCHYGY